MKKIKYDSNYVTINNKSNIRNKRTEKDRALEI